MRRFITIIFILLPSYFISGQIVCGKSEAKPITNNKIDSLLNILNSPDDTYVMVVAHRGDCSNAPENSLQAIKNAITIGTDIIEIDVQFTKDSIPILMHDKTLNRTTTGHGKVSHRTFNSLQELYLTNRNGNATPYKIPSLEDALLLTKGKVLINLDKCSMHLNKIIKYLHKTNTLNQIIISLKRKHFEIPSQKKISNSQIIFIPRIIKKSKRQKKLIHEFISKHSPPLIDIKLSKKDSHIISWVNQLKKKSCRISTSTTTVENINNRNSGGKQLKSIEKWEWALQLGANILITDEPALLIDYLRNKGLRKQREKSSSNLNSSITNLN